MLFVSSVREFANKANLEAKRDIIDLTLVDNWEGYICSRKHKNPAQ